MSNVEYNRDWLPLDNAAKIYPSTASEKSPAEFRLAFSLEKPVRLLWLQRALERIMPRFPYFQVNLKRGFFWYYLQRSNEVPQVELMQNVSVTILSIKERTASLLRVSTREKTIAVDFSHILTDGNGAIRFLLTLAAEYLRQSGTEVEEHPNIFDPDATPEPQEFEDAHRKNFVRKTIAPEKMPPAYHLPGAPFKTRRYRVIHGLMPTKPLLQAARDKKVSLTEYLTALYMYSIMQVRSDEVESGSSRKSPIIRIEVPVDMRKYYPSVTMRNFSLFLSPELNTKLGIYSFEEILRHVHHTVQLLKSEKQLLRQISRNVGSEFNPLIRFLPLFLKDLIISSVHSSLGEALHSGVISNLGSIDVPATIKEQVESFTFNINPNHVMKKGCGVLSYKDTLSISISSVTEEREFERLFFTHLSGLGIPITLKEY